MLGHRKRRRTRRSTFGKRGLALFAGMALLMLVAILLFILPQSRHQNISIQAALLLSLLLWVAAVFAVWACVRSRRRRYSHGQTQMSGTKNFANEET